MYKCEKCKDTWIKSFTLLWSMKIDDIIPDFCDCTESIIKRDRFWNSEDTLAKVRKVQRLKIDLALKDSWLPKKFEDKKLESIGWKIRSSVDNYLKEYPRWLYLYWPTGTWKTYTVSAIANYLIDKWVEIRMVNLADMAYRVKNSWDNPESNDKMLFDRLKKSELLILDDLGTEKHSEWIEEQLFSIVNYRYERDMPIIITSNIALGDLEYNARIISRIFETCTQICFDDIQNFRLKKS